MGGGVRARCRITVGKGAVLVCTDSAKLVVFRKKNFPWGVPFAADNPRPISTSICDKTKELGRCVRTAYAVRCIHSAERETQPTHL